MACLSVFGSSEALARTTALTLTAADLDTMGANRTLPNAALLADRHSIAGVDATKAAALQVETIAVDDAIAELRRKY
jgi:hypothetical protein